MLRDDLSCYKLFSCMPNTDVENAAIIIIKWGIMFGVPTTFMSDCSTHFKTEAFRLVAKGLKVHHNFTLAYCTWSNGAVERLDLQRLCVRAAILSALQVSREDWTDRIPIVQSVLNNSSSPHRGIVCLITALVDRYLTLLIMTFLRTET